MQFTITLQNSIELEGNGTGMSTAKNEQFFEKNQNNNDVIEIIKIKNIEGLLVTIDIEKAFDSLDDNFLIFTLEKNSFGQNFILWVKVLLKDQELFVINGDKSTKHFLVR